MSQFHVGIEQMEKFLRAELSRQENQGIIRHLLTECPLCRGTVQRAARYQGFKIPAETGAEPVLEVARAG
jgi:Fe-S oxidoreductase